MNRSRRNVSRGAALTAILVATGWVGFHFIRPALAADAAKDAGDEKAATSQPAGDDQPQGTASVKTAVVRAGEITQSITAYGSVTAQPGAVAVFSVSFECHIKHLFVTGGQAIDKGAALVELEPSPEAKLQLLEARNAVDAADKDLQQTQKRFDMKLATNQDLLTAQQTAQVSKLRLEAAVQRGEGDESHKITADSAGLVSKIDVQEGQIVSAGLPLIETLSRNTFEVRLGVEPSNVGRLKADQAVKIHTLTAGAGEDAADDAKRAKVRLISQRVNPDTRLVDVFASLESTDGLLLDSPVRAELEAEKKQTLIVPRDAVLPDEEGMLLFTVKDGKAVKHVVKVGLKNDKEVEVSGEDLKAGDPVVILGNLELEDGMAVSVEGER